jgi:hypothetical protein
MDENGIGKTVVDAAVQVHREPGPGLFETVYGIVLPAELQHRGLRVDPAMMIGCHAEGEFPRFTGIGCPQAALVGNPSSAISVHTRMGSSCKRSVVGIALMIVSTGLGEKAAWR